MGSLSSYGKFAERQSPMIENWGDIRKILEKAVFSRIIDAIYQ